MNHTYESYYHILSRCHLFHGIPSDSYLPILKLLQSTIKTLKKGEVLLHLGDSFTSAFIVLDGIIEGSFVNENFDKININQFGEGALLGEALACTKATNSPIQLTALSDCKVLTLNLSVLFSTSQDQCECQHRVCNNLILGLAKQNVFSNLKLRIMSQKALRDRIFIYLKSLIPDENDFLHIPFTQTALAEFLGVNRSALSRELGRMQDENLIQIVDKKIRLLY